MAKKINEQQLLQLVEAAIFASDKPLSVNDLQSTVLESFELTRKRLQQALSQLQQDYLGRGIQLIETASGFRFQTRADLSEYLALLWPERSPRYSRAVLETLALIAYRQPITRGEIEEVRGVTVSSQIMRTLLDRGWVKVVGHKEVPGRPGLYATTPTFLDYFGLKDLSDLPALAEFQATPDFFNPVVMTEEIH
ncbi:MULTISPECIES: SMC-Scp complex subunit ScpB [unclassified Rheinheimera]|jgi:segregation and condensation protein B|uniref:SMC-Scp complex subunit ScpB n=1 Tax=unclassified Rheinheimera TaxID=115860 RepID=UPI00021252EC|nr:MULTISPECIES: SMC-Scp complex subunit ScpB [unclassified Rheinheimera]EGM78090.1 segregation and condensation protein B [Rheinheimera sp. A13L]KOO58289.1 condensin subunit ScpB [Rheinheimera sp. KL1]MBU0910951.1 SMC-Scp complex subunit ScpB [Gammaproteobacteria bacterium]MDF3125660.1 SMC-Scp complex subunit ScpB [Rheinheimera sp. 1928-s]